MKKLFLIFAILLFAACDKDTYYTYDIKAIEEACEDNGGFNRFTSNKLEIKCWCNDGTLVRINSRDIKVKLNEE